MSEPVVVITGASSGIGAETARLLAGNGFRLMLAARRTERLEALSSELGSDRVATLRADVTQQEAMSKLAQATLERFGQIDVWINNAGLMPLSFLSQLKVDEWDRMVDVNIKGVLYGIAAALPHFRQQQGGHFINVASIAGHTVFPTGAVYCATKHAVRALTEGLRQEENRIRATLISPGAVATELTDSISDPKIAMGAAAAYREALPADSIAEAILWSIRQPAEVDVNEIVIRPLSQRS